MAGPIDVKRKEVHRLDTGYTIYVTLTCDLTQDLDLGFFKVKFRNRCISGIVRLIDVKWKGTELVKYWADCMTFPFDHTHDLDLDVSSSKFEIALSQEWDGRLTWNERGVSRPFMIMILTCVSPRRGGWMYQIVTGWLQKSACRRHI